MLQPLRLSALTRTSRKRQTPLLPRHKDVVLNEMLDQAGRKKDGFDDVTAPDSQG